MRYTPAPAGRRSACYARFISKCYAATRSRVELANFSDRELSKAVRWLASTSLHPLSLDAFRRRSAVVDTSPLYFRGAELRRALRPRRCTLRKSESRERDAKLGMG